MGAWSVVNFASLFPGLDLAAEHYHPDKLNSLKRLSRVGRAVASYVRAVRQLVNPRSNDATPIFDLGASANHILQPADAQSEERVSTKKVCRGGDIVVSRLRSYLRQVAFVPPEIGKAYLSTEFIVLRGQPGTDVTFLLPFILSDPVQTILAWSQDGNEHPRFNENVLLGFLVPPAVECLTKKLSNIVAQAASGYGQGRTTFANAEALLVSALGLDKLDLAPRLFYESQYKSLNAAGRFDAEYYQPAKMEVLHALAKMKGRPVGEQYRSAKSLWQPGKVPRDERVRNYDLPDALSPFLDDTLEPTPASSTTWSSVISWKRGPVKSFSAARMIASRRSRLAMAYASGAGTPSFKMELTSQYHFTAGPRLCKRYSGCSAAKKGFVSRVGHAVPDAARGAVFAARPGLGASHRATVEKRGRPIFPRPEGAQSGGIWQTSQVGKWGSRVVSRHVVVTGYRLLSGLSTTCNPRFRPEKPL